ncbi:MAG: DUF2059 domain-containing protein [Candidatus Omnitrophica bacterium]|nr:DUF2059 domain-containing protein [Candidatus Omnitrophota bacterium]
MNKLTAILCRFSVIALLLAIGTGVQLTGPFRAEAANPLPASVDNLMKLSGITEQYGDMLDDVAAGLELQRDYFSMLSDEDFSSMAEQVVAIFQPDEILRGIRNEIARSLSDEDVARLIAWYQSDIGRKITDLEVQASTQESHRKMMAMKELQLSKTQRVAFARRFDELLKLSHFAMEYYKIQQEAMVIALNGLLTSDELIDTEEYHRQVELYEDEIREQTEEMITVSIVFTYRWLSDGELEEYMQFNQQDYALKLSQAVFRGAVSAMRRMLEQMAQAGAATRQ